MLHLSELHGAATHLAIIAIPLAALLLVLRRLGIGGDAVAAAEPWSLGAAVLGIALAGVTGLLVRGEAQTELRGTDGSLNTFHLVIGIVLAVLVVVPAGVRLVAARRGRAVSGTGGAFAAVAVLALLAVPAQGYLGGRMTYEHGVGVDRAGQFAQSGRGVAALELALAKGTPPVQAGKAAFSEQGLGCAECHGNLAQGQRGPRLAGGRGLDDFRRVHAGGLFPPKLVTDQDFRAIDAYLHSLDPSHQEGGGD